MILFDIEASQLKADFGRMLAFGWKELGKGKKATVKTVMDFQRRFKKDPTDDKELVKYAREVLEDADLWITWYGTYFDVPFINTRLLAHGLSPLPPTAHTDGWKIARFGLKLHSNRLASVSEFLGLEEKTPLKQQVWTRATAGHPSSIRYVGQHCAQDVIVLEQAYNRIKTFNKQVVNRVSDDTTRHRCPHCASTNLQIRGWSLSYKSKRRRFQCMDCGGWGSGKPISRALLS